MPGTLNLRFCALRLRKSRKSLCYRRPRLCPLASSIDLGKIQVLPPFQFFGQKPFYTNPYRSLRRALRLTRVTAAPDVVASRGDTSKDGLRGDGCRDRPLHAELKLFAENPALRARAPRQSCTGLIEAHGKQFFIAALEEVGSLGIVRCISHGCLFDAVKGAIQEAQNSSQGS